MKTQSFKARHRLSSNEWAASERVKMRRYKWNRLRDCGHEARYTVAGKCIMCERIALDAAKKKR